jgi:hypothetical protein
MKSGNGAAIAPGIWAVRDFLELRIARDIRLELAMVPEP